MRLKYSGPEPVIVPDAGLTVIPGTTVEIPDAIAASLVKRDDWHKATAATTKESD